MVLASGQYTFSCNPVGVFSLTDLPRENDGTVKRQMYADGFIPKIDTLTGSTAEAVVMTRIANAAVVTSLLGDKDGSGLGLIEGDQRSVVDSFLFDSREPDDPVFTDVLPTRPSFSYVHSFSLPRLPILSATLELFTLGVQDGDNQVAGSDTDITLSIDGVDLPGAFDNVDQFERSTSSGWVDLAGVVSFAIPNSMLNLFDDGSAEIEINILQLGSVPSTDAIAIDYSELNITPVSGACPSYNTPYDPGVFPDSAGSRIDISGSVLLQNTQTPICSMVLANGQYMFSCDGSGNYALNIPLDINGQFKLQVYAAGFVPTIQTFDEFQAINDVRMARAVECQ